MTTMIFVNLPVKNLPQSMEFFGRLGFTFNPQFTDETAACMVVSETIYTMLLTEAKFQSFTPKPVSDARQSTEVLIALSCDSAAEVDALVAKAVSAGATTPVERKDHGFMVQHGFADLDGHQWEVFWMDESAAPAQM